MTALLVALDFLISIARTAALLLAVAALLAALLDRAVRKRQINPFSYPGRFSRRVIDPLLAPFERRLLLSGRPADSAAWWMVGAVVVGGLLTIALLAFIRDELFRMAVASQQGAGGILMLVVGWAFAVVKIALIVRVLSSWFRLNPFSRGMRLVYALTEWILRPLRQLIPPIGGTIDLSPLIAYFLLSLLGGAVRSVL
jgi:YggT family protein